MRFGMAVGLALWLAAGLPATAEPAEGSARPNELADLRQEMEALRKRLQEVESRLTDVEKRLGDTYRPVTPFTTIERRLEDLENAIKRR